MLKMCSPMTLRGTNLAAIIMVAMTSAQCRRLIEARLAERDGRPQPSNHFNIYAAHTGMNMALFPVLFFFSALYYTDVFSTWAVLFTFYNHLQRIAPKGKSWLNDATTVILGAITLFMRQTNVFWVVVFMGSLEAIHAVKALRPAPVQKPDNMQGLADLARFYGWRYSLGEIHDPSLNLVWMDDWLFCVASIAIAIVCNPIRVAKQVWPHVVVMGLFVAFVLWNGSVVLGDKSNHVATLHLAQMLYIWPLFAFFSAPLLLPSFMWIIATPWISCVELLNISKQNGTGEASRSGASNVAPWLHYIFTSKLPISTVYSLCSLAISLLVVKFNTILHPFTLADNRHYMFYVFRYTILRSSWVRYILIPVYTFCRQVLWTTLGGCWANSLSPQDKDCPVGKEIDKPIAFYNRPFTDASTTSVLVEAGNGQVVKTQSNPDERSSNTPVGTLTDVQCTSTTSPSTSTALLWLLTTTLSLTTAPLVEPRYFILPWVFWRLLLPAWPTHTCIPPSKPESRLSRLSGPVGWVSRKGREVDIRLFLETVWFLVINLVTMYIFLSRPFFWVAQDGTYLDEGRVQRFMW